MNLLKKSLQNLMIFALLLSLLPTFMPITTVKATENLINVAGEGTVIVDKEDLQWGGTKDKMIDGDDTTAWAYPTGSGAAVWPGPITARLQLQQGTDVKKIVIKLGGGDVANRSADVTVDYYQNSVIDTPLFVESFDDQAMGSEIVIDLDTTISATDIIVTLSDAKEGGAEGKFWPSIRELEVYKVGESAGLSDYNNIASLTTITTDGTANPDPAPLVDGDYTSLYLFHGEQLTSPKYINLSFDARLVDATKIVFEKVASEPYNYEFTYSIYGKNGNGEYDTIVSQAKANRTDNTQQEYKFAATTYTDIKIVMDDCTSSAGKGWPAVAEFELYGENDKVSPDPDNIALNKPVHTSSGKNVAKNINDGSAITAWRGIYYPSFVDIDLEANYALTDVEVFLPTNGYSEFTVYTSMDGRDFTKLGEKLDDTITDKAVIAGNGIEARYVRVYVEYNSANASAQLNEVRVTGTATNTALQSRPEVDVEVFEGSEYDVEITTQDTLDEVYAIIERQLGTQYKEWFTFELAENPNGTGYDYFTIKEETGKIKITGNDGVSLAMGLNHYLKYFCEVNISQVSKQVKMPSTMVPVNEEVFKETKIPVRYSYNYCTLSYTMAFWGEEEWRNELDWLALNGVNVVLDSTGQEEVWRRFLTDLGYTHEEAKNFITGPAYYAWAYMANMTGFGGPVHDSWFEERTELARKNQLSMRKLGMQPALQGYSGMVPTDIMDYDADATIIPQGTWCSFARPAMLVTTSDKFDEYAEKFYAAQKAVYGDVSDYYATDPFHEGGNTGGMNVSSIASEVLNSMLDADPEGIWIIQAWQGNPSYALLQGLTGRREHALILDLYAERQPKWQNGEFQDTPWVYCMLSNFGGRLGLYGHLDNMVNAIPNVLNNAEHVEGFGISPESSENNPVLYEFLFESIWVDDATAAVEKIDMEVWLDDYATRRYGAESESANEAWQILYDTVYKGANNENGQGSPESVTNARPRLDINAASTWGNSIIGYDKIRLEEAAALLLEDYELLKESPGYVYDLANVLQQVLSNSAQEVQLKMSQAFRANDLEEFKKQSSLFLEIMDAMNTVTGSTEYFLLGRWTEDAKELAANADEFTEELYELNAKGLVTTWGSINQANGGGLSDYSNRQWSGLISDYYKARWQRWIDARINELSGLPFESNINWFEMEWEYARENTVYTNEVNNADLNALGKEILSNYSVIQQVEYPTIDAASLTITSSIDEVDQNLVVDENTATGWMVESSKGIADEYIEIELDGAYMINQVNYEGFADGTFNDICVDVSVDGKTWVTVAKQDTEVSAPTAVKFPVTKAKYIRLSSTSTTHSDPSKVNQAMSASELSVHGEAALSAYDNIADQGSVTTDGVDNIDPQNLIDKNHNTLHKFHNAALVDERYVSITFDKPKTVDALQVVFESLNPDPSAYDYTYSIYGKTVDGEYETIVEKAKANRETNVKQIYKFAEKEYTEFKINFDNLESTLAGGGWPSLAEFEIYGTDAADPLLGEKQVAHNMLDAIDLTVFREEQKATIITLIATAKLNITAATTSEDIQNIVNETKATIDEYPTDEELSIAEQLANEKIKLEDILKKVDFYSLVEEHYTADTYSALRIAHLGATDAYANAITIAAVQAAIEHLQVANGNLVLKDADYDALHTALEEAIAIDASLYNSFDAVQNAMDAVVYGLDITQQTTVDDYTADLVRAIENLTKKTTLTDDPSFIIETTSIKQGEIIRVKLMNGHIDDFMHVYVNGSRLTKDVDYTVQSGSIVVEINGTYTSQLSEGNVTIQLVTTEMIYEGIVEMNNTPNTGEEVKPTTPPTGDTSNYMMYLFLFMLSAMGIILKVSKK